MDFKQLYNDAEEENSRLRQHLAWAAQFLPADKIRELQTRITSKEGHVVKDGVEEDADYFRDWKKLCVQAAELLREGMNYIPESALITPTISHWCGKAEGAASKLMEFDPPKSFTLLDVREPEKPCPVIEG